MMFTYYIVYPLACVIGLLPEKVQFFISDIIAFMLHRVVRYRVQVVRENLKNSFPEKSESELRDIESKFYTQLADIFVETMALASISRKTILRRMEFTNVDYVEEATAGKSWVVAMAHYSSWEYGVNYSLHTRHDAFVPVYRPLADKGIDKYYYKIRSRFGAVPVPMKDVMKEMIKRRRDKSTVALVLIGDQTPPRPIHNWTMFLGRETPFFMGMEKIALKYHLPVWYMHVDRVKRGHYKAWYEMLYDGVEQVPEHEITRRYAAKLEEIIRKQPELWLWSHRRWKHKKEDIA